MRILFEYSIRSILKRKRSTMSVILCVAGVVAVFVGTLSMANGFKKMLTITGSEENVLLLRKGSQAEMMSIITKNQFKIIGDYDEIEREKNFDPLISGEVVVVAPMFHKASKSNALAQIRGVSSCALKVHKDIKIIKGRFFNEGVYEVVGGKRAEEMYEGLKLNSFIKLGGLPFKVVGIMESNGSLYESEIWCDSRILNDVYKRPINLYSVVSAKLKNRGFFEKFKEKIEKDPKLNLDVKIEKDFFEEQSRVMTTIIRVLGFLIAFVMGIGATFAAFNSVYSSFSDRIREIATLRALGFSKIDSLMTILFESVLVCFFGGFIGIIISLPLNGFSTSTLNFQSFSQVAFEFEIGPYLLLQGLLFSIIIGIFGGLIPAIKAYKLSIAFALREK